VWSIVGTTQTGGGGALGEKPAPVDIKIVSTSKRTQCLYYKDQLVKAVHRNDHT
jgi:hypothetical protein